MRDCVATKILQSDVEDRSAKLLVGEAIGNVADIRGGQSGVLLIAQTERNEQSCNTFSIWREEIHFDWLRLCAIDGTNSDLSELAVTALHGQLVQN